MRGAADAEKRRLRIAAAEKLGRGGAAGRGRAGIDERQRHFQACDVGPDVVILGAEIRGLPGGRAGELDLAVVAELRAALDVIGDDFVRPGAEGAPPLIGLGHGGAIGEDGAATLGTLGERKRTALAPHQAEEPQHQARAARDHHRIDEDQAAHEVGPFGGHHQARRAAHRMTAEQHRTARLGGEVFHHADEIVAEDRPAAMARRIGGEPRLPMPAGIPGADVEAPGERRQQAAIGHAVEAVGMSEVERRLASSVFPFEERNGAVLELQFAPQRRRLVDVEAHARGSHGALPCFNVLLAKV